MLVKVGTSFDFGTPVYVESGMICGIVHTDEPPAKPDSLGTKIYTSTDYDYLVRETPEEVFALITEGISST